MQMKHFTIKGFSTARSDPFSIHIRFILNKFICCWRYQTAYDTLV